MDVLICSPYKFYGPHLGTAFARRELLERWRPYKVRPAPEEPPGHRFETGTLPHELLAGYVAAVEYMELDRLGGDPVARERARRTLPRRPAGEGRAVRAAHDGRPRHDLRLQRQGRGAREVAERLGEENIAVWHGNYYAVEVMRRLELEPEGAVRAGIVHYNTAEEVDRLLEALGRF